MSFHNKSLSKNLPPSFDRSSSPRSKISTANSQTQPITQPKSAQFLIKQEFPAALSSSPSELDSIAELNRAVDFIPDLLKVLATSSTTESVQSNLSLINQANSSASSSGAFFSSTTLSSSSLSTLNPYPSQAAGMNPLPSPSAVDDIRARIRAARDLLTDSSPLAIPSLESNLSADQRAHIHKFYYAHLCIFSLIN